MSQVDSEKLVELLARGNEEPGDIGASLDRIARVAQEVLKADICVLFGFNPITGDALRPPIFSGELSESGRSLLLQPRRDGLTRRILAKGPLFIQDLYHEDGAGSDFSQVEGIHSFAAAALLTTRQRKPLAVAYLDFRQPQQFSTKWRDLFGRFTRQAALALQQAWYLRRTREIVRVGQEVNQGLENPAQLFQKLQGHIGEILDTSHAFLLATLRRRGGGVDVYSKVDGESTVQRGLSLPEDEVAAEASLAGLLAGIVPWPPGDLLHVSLRSRGKLLGALSLLHPTPEVYDAADQQLLDLLANHVALALSNLQLFEDIGRLNQVGQILTRHLESGEVLQLIVDVIRDVTASDLTLVFPYVQATESFELPPSISGPLWQPDFELPRYIRPDDVAALAVRKERPVFARDSHTLYASLDGVPEERKGNFENREGIRSTAAVPLRVGEEPVGVLFVNYRTVQDFDELQQRLIEGPASYAAVAIKNAREFGAQSRQHIRELEIVRGIDTALSRSKPELESLLKTILKLASTRVQADAAAILLYDLEREELRIGAAIGIDAERRLGQVLKVKEETIRVQAFQRLRPILIEESTTKIRSKLDVPLIDGNSALGILRFESFSPGAFDEGHQRFLVILAGQAVLAVKRAQAYETERRLAEDRQILVDIGRDLTQHLDLQRVLASIVERAVEVTRSSCGVLMLVDPKTDRLIVAWEQGYPKDVEQKPATIREGIIGYVARTGKAVNADVTQPPWSEVFLGVMPGTRSELAVPLHDGDVLRGVLNLESPEDKFYSETDKYLICGLSDLAVIALQNAKRFEESEKQRSRLKALNQVGRTILELLDEPDRLMRAVVEHALQLTGAKLAELDLFEESGLTATYLAYKSNDDVFSDQPFDQLHLGSKPPRRGIMEHVRQTRTAYRTRGDATLDPLYVGDRDGGIQSELAVPLLKGGAIFGVLNVESEVSEAFDEDDEELLGLFAAQAVVLIENTRNFAAAKRREQRLDLLYRAGQELAAITDIEGLPDAYEIVLKIAKERWDSQAVVRRYDPEKKELVREKIAKTEGPEPFDRISLDDDLNGWVAREKKTRILPEADHPPPEIKNFRRSNPNDKAFVITPILFRDLYWGNLSLSHPVANHFSTGDVRLIEGLAQQLAVTIHRLEQVRVNQEAERRAQELEAMSWVGQQASEMAHRLGNDLGLVKTSVQKIRKAATRDGTVDPVIGRESENILSDIEKVLSLSKILSDELSPETAKGEFVVIPVRELIGQAIESLTIPPAVADKIQLDVPTSDLGLVKVVPKQIVAALLNLLANGLDAMPQGGRLTVEASGTEREVRIAVRDTGRGIAPENLQKIYQLFYSTKPGSIGFGLWSVLRNVLNNRGKIEVESKVGLGTTFTLQLPRAEEAASG